jgi:hypothetical protein
MQCKLVYTKNRQDVMKTIMIHKNNYTTTTTTTTTTTNTAQLKMQKIRYSD